MTNNRTSLILHGHFYQPPRENPATGIIPRQDTGSRYLNWNEKIYQDCYSANAHSRYLDPDGKIISLTNNFSYISFNFGPTLLKWIHETHPETEEMLIEADRASLSRLGHGNAMAQCFNHTILALDRVKDARLQIEWGARDFEARFCRKAEGMWLAEAGINSDVIQLLSEEGMKFVVLSPWQCRAVEDEEGKMTLLAGKPAPYWQPYILTGTNGGEIAAFFYHPGLAEGISFGHMLRDADSLYTSLKTLKEKDNKPLLHTATDGEIYGHHEPYGDMALAALIRKVGERDDFEFDNYASYLEKHPAALHAELHAGEGGKGTSWSCSHGVSRWYKDCGCTTGGKPGWNQAWRTPLRNGLNNLAGKLDEIFILEMRRIFGDSVDPYDILRQAGDEFAGLVSMAEFLADLHTRYDFQSSYDVELAHLLTGIKNKHFSFTSCGFFFADISGIEPRQNIKYALYAIRMFQPYCAEDLTYPFLSELRKAKSNVKTGGDGMSIAQEAMKELAGEVEAVVYFYLNRQFAREEDYVDQYGRFHLTHIDQGYKDDFSARLIDEVNLDVWNFHILSSSSIDNGINLYICVSDSTGASTDRIRITNNDIPEAMLLELYAWIDKSMERMTFTELTELAKDMRHYSMLVKHSKYVQLDSRTLENLGMTMKIIKSLFTVYVDVTPDLRMRILGNMFDLVQKCGREAEKKSLDEILSQHAAYLAKRIARKGLNPKECASILDLMNLSTSHGFTPETGELQNAVYPYYKGTKKAETISPSLLKSTCAALNFK